MKRLLLMSILAACGKAEAPAPPPPAVSSAASPWSEARAATGHPLLEAPAVALGDPEQRAELSVPSRARVLRVRVAVGDEVARGAPLVDVAYPELAAAAASYLGATDQLAAIERRHQQLQSLRAEGLARAGDLSAIEVEQARLRGERDLAAASLRAAGIDPDRARGFLDGGGRAHLVAPIGGTVVQVDVALGQLRVPESGALVELAAGGVHRVEVRLAQPLPTGAPLVFIPAGGGERVARLVRTEPGRGGDGTLRAWLAVDGAGLVPGQTGRVRAVVGDEVVAIPASAVSATSEVWRRAGERRERVAVTVVARSGADALVTGLRAGDQVAGAAP